MEDKEFYLKLRKMLDTLYPNWQNYEHDSMVQFDDDNWVSIRVPYFFNKNPSKWDGSQFTRDLKDEELENIKI